MKFYYLEDINREHCQMFTTKKAALNWIDLVKGAGRDDSDRFTKEDIQILYVPHTSKKSLLNAFNDVSFILGNAMGVPELYND